RNPTGGERLTGRGSRRHAPIPWQDWGMRHTSVFRRLPVLAAPAAFVLGCGSSASGAPGASMDATAGPNGGSSSGAGTSDDVMTGSSSGSGDAATTGTPPPVDAGACPNLPALLDGGWLNVSPPGSNYASTYSGVNAVAVRPDNPAIVYAGVDSNGMFRSTDCGA